MFDFSIYIQAISAAGLALLFHNVIGNFPEPLEKIRNDKREIGEALLVWGIRFAIILSLIFLNFDNIVFFSGLALSFLLPFIFLRGWKKGPERKAIGINKPRDNKTALYFIGFFFLFAFITYFFTGGKTHNTFIDFIVTLIWGFITPALTEELIHRSIITSKLERSLGIRYAWILGGILFGLMHIPNDFFGYLWFEVYHQDLLFAIGGLLVQIATGWMFAITYIKTRSIIPSVIGHFLLDFLTTIMAFFLIP